MEVNKYNIRSFLSSTGDFLSKGKSYKEFIELCDEIMTVGLEYPEEIFHIHKLIIRKYFIRKINAGHVYAFEAIGFENPKLSDVEIRNLISKLNIFCNKINLPIKENELNYMV